MEADTYPSALLDKFGHEYNKGAARKGTMMEDTMMEKIIGNYDFERKQKPSRRISEYWKAFEKKMAGKDSHKATAKNGGKE